MPAELTTALKAQIFAQESADPFLMLITLTTSTAVYRLVNNSEDITSGGYVFSAYPLKITLPVDDGQSAREFSLDFDNTSLLLVKALRTVTDPIPVQIDMILASMPDVIQISIPDLQIVAATYDKQKLSAKVVLDNFLAVAMTSEAYSPSIYPGIF
jgi:hypothetical protein